MEVFYKASVADANENYIADLTINSITVKNIVATINDFSEELKASMSESSNYNGYMDGEDSLYISREVRLFIYDDIKGILKYSAYVSYRLKTLVHFERMSLLSTIQRRNDVKVKVMIPLVIAPTMETVKNGRTENVRLLNKSVDGQIVDLSAGGLAFACSNELDKDLLYNMVFDRTPRQVDVNLKIIREIQKPDGSYIYGCKFDNITQKDEELIRQYVFRALAQKHASTRR